MPSESRPWKAGLLLGKICDSVAGQFLNKQVEEDPKGFSSMKARELGEQLGITFNRQTWYSHLRHITHPLISYQKAALADPVLVPKTNQGVLEAIRDLGMKRAAEHPDEVTVDHAIKAATALENRRLGSDNVIVMIAKWMSTSKPEDLESDTIEGRWREVPAEEATQ